MSEIFTPKDSGEHSPVATDPLHARLLLRAGEGLASRDLGNGPRRLMLDVVASIPGRVSVLAGAGRRVRL